MEKVIQISDTKILQIYIDTSYIGGDRARSAILFDHKTMTRMELNKEEMNTLQKTLHIAY